MSFTSQCLYINGVATSPGRRTGTEILKECKSRSSPLACWVGLVATGTALNVSPLLWLQKPESKHKLAPLALHLTVTLDLPLCRLWPPHQDFAQAGPSAWNLGCSFLHPDCTILQVLVPISPEMPS